jgi:excisionase family DNA binding protein
MLNERLRGCLVAAQMTVSDVAARLGVDPKTVERWITTGRVPYPAHRRATAALLKTTEVYLWPDLLDEIRVTSTSQAELVSLYPNRGAVPGASGIG